MNHIGRDGEFVGGGEILEYWGKQQQYQSSWLDNELVKLFHSIPFIKFAIYLAILFIMAVVILRLFNIRTLGKGKGVNSEIENVNAIRKRDEAIVRANKLINWATRVIEASPFALSKSSLEYWQYNLTRAGIKIPGGARIIRAVEFHALIQICTLAALAVSLLILILANVMLGTFLVIAVVFIATVVPLRVVRSMVAAKDLEIKSNFSDFYLMIHYVLLASASTPLSGIMKSYQKTTTSKEMQRFIDVAVSYIDTHGEYEATNYIANDYREVSEIVKLMRLIRQANEGGNVEAELMGFRNELLKAKQYAIQKHMEKIVGRAQRSFNILMIVLFQAVLSAMAIYLPDLGVAGSIMMG